jgi:signal transduction histidine kinase
MTTPSAGADDSAYSTDPDHADERGNDERTKLGTALSFTLALSAVTIFGMTIAWAAAGGGYYWPRWVLLGCLAVVAVLGVLVHLRSSNAPHRWLLTHADIDIAIGSYLIVIWIFTGFKGGIWPIWPILGLGLLYAVHLLALRRHELPPVGRIRLLNERVETLTRTRAGALDLQNAELRRIERDLHDGAQARLVALSMKLGRAEARLDDDPDTAALVRSAREEAAAAIAELRDIARGISPPILVDRGLPAAVQSLADRAPVKVDVTVDGLGRLPPVIESAAYFVVAEALTNVAKHAPGAEARTTLAERGGRLILDIADNGPGGADPNATGLAGLRARVEALDGTLTVVSPRGGPTIVHAELPCAS